MESNAPSPLLPRIAAGDVSAVRDVLERYGRLVWALSRRLSHDGNDAEDAVQEIFVELWKSAARFDPQQGSEATFVTTIARRRLIDRRRAHVRRGVPLNDPFDEGALLADTGAMLPPEACAEAGLAAKAVATLRPEQRTALLLSTCGGLTHDEIAGRMAMPLGTVKAHVRRGLEKVRALLFARDASLIGEEEESL